MIKPSECSSPGSVVIVVDDDPAVRHSLEFSLEIEGYTVRTYPGGRELLADGEIPGSACLVIDQNMPGINGLDVIAKLRERHVSAPAILITGHPTPALRARAAKAAVPVIEKPLLTNALVDCICEAFSRPNGAGMT
jgi:two-component system, LuxR family, response regulator FixJ